MKLILQHLKYIVYGAFGIVGAVLLFLYYAWPLVSFVWLVTVLCIGTRTDFYVWLVANLLLLAHLAGKYKITP